MTTFEEYKARPISTPVKKWDWIRSRLQPIEECGERLVSMSYAPEKILANSQYCVQLLEGALPDVLCREGVLRRLLGAADHLPRGFRFVVYDCWRPVRVQQSLFEELKGQLRDANPGKTDDELQAMTLTYVALPSEDETKPSPHNTGGAIDLTIVDDQGFVLNMGGDYDDASEISNTAYLENKLARGEVLTADEIEACENRRAFYGIMTDAGFSNYIDEWWHFDFGNQNWAWVTGAANAIYGRKAPGLPWNHEIK